MRALPFLLLLAACGGGGSAPASVPAPLLIAPTALPPGTVGAFYSATLSASGGAGSGYSWSLALGSLPPGLGGIPAAGRLATLSGTPAAAGSYSFMVELRDAEGDAVTIAYTVVVSAGGPGPGPGPGPGGGTWRSTNVAGAPSARGYHTAVWTGTEMIVWGGLDYLGVKNTGGAYDPVRDTWRATSTANAPAPRFAHTAVWTGTEMIVWGGWDAAGVRGDGGAYDPVTDSWRAIATSGAPEARALHTAVWTGSRMIVWGGQGIFPPPAPNSVDKVFGDGFAYDPVADAWSPIASPGPPASRVHTAAWTGARMIVWGGRDAFALTLVTQNTGGAYDPAGDSWSATDTATAPAARMDHTAVWTGAVMVVWGGTTGIATRVASGGRYSLTGNSWSATSLAGAPVGRSGHAAVWTGSRMLVWGGTGAPGGFLADGAAYDPSADSWRALPSAGAPAPRAGHTAVWTGASMIVWGGATEPADTYLATGGVFTP